MPAKNCDICGVSMHIGYRIYTPELGGWKFSCPQCLKPQQAKAGYHYGGTWKSKEKRLGLI